MNNILDIVLAGVSVVGAFGGLVWLVDNNILKNFTDEQIEQIIQQAYAQSKASGLITAVKKEAK